MVKNAKKKFGISVVIPTLGAVNLKPTLEALLHNTLPPEEIIICVPSVFYHRCLKYQELATILKTNFKGQVAQRIEGFQAASHAVVVQCDDDLLPQEKCLEKMAACLLHERCAVGPRFRGPNGRIASGLLPIPGERSFFEKIIDNLLFFVANGPKGFQPGCVSKVGIGFGVGETNKKNVQMEWLPGGMVMYHNKDLILRDFYPYQGKAFSEDIFHSFELRNKNIQLFLATEAVCLISDHTISIYKQIGHYTNYFFRYLQFCKKLQVSEVRFFLYWWLNLTRLAIQWIKENFL